LSAVSSEFSGLAADCFFAIVATFSASRYPIDTKISGTSSRQVSTMQELDRQESEIRNLKLLLYFMPVFGIIPALWSLNRTDSTKEERNLSRVVVKLALTWFASYMLFDVSAGNIEPLHIPLLLTSSLITSSYFVLNLALVILLWQRKSVQLPFFGRVSRLP
jgi:hypothetical protein